MQDFEFTIEEGQLYFLQTRDAKRTAWAAIQVAVDLVRAGVIDPATASTRLAPYDLAGVHRTVAQPGPGSLCLTNAVGACPGTVSGAVALSASRAEQVSRQRPTILVRHELATDDFSGIAASAGLLTAVGSRTSHAAVVARQLNRPCVVGCTDLQIDEQGHTCVIGGRRVAEGDFITIDGDTGRVYAGVVPVVTEHPDALLAAIREWDAIAVQ
jgi:pyruvate,orthophosphate dikinase